MQIRCPIDVYANDSLNAKLNRMSCVMYVDADAFSHNLTKDIYFLIYPLT